MSQAILLRGGAGGVTSDDVTASKSHVLQGYKTVTTDSNDEVVEGTIQDRGVGNIDGVADTISTRRERLSIFVPEGYYHKNNNNERPWIWVTLKEFQRIIKLNKDKILESENYLGEQGTIPIRGYRGPNCTETFMYQADGGYVVRIEEGYYHKSGQRKPYVVVPPTLMKSAVNYHPEKTLSDTRTCEEQGQIKMVDTKLNNYTNNQAKFVGMDVGRGKLVMGLGHGNAYYFRDDNNPHVEADAAAFGDVTADKVMRGFTATSKNGIKFAGTMPDLQSGRTVFNGATFDNELVSGVANKGFYLNGTYFAYSLNQNYGYAGIYNGGMNFNLSTGYPALKSRRIGCVLSQSINLTPFRQIVISYRTLANIQGNPYATLEAHVNRASTRSLIDVAGAGKVDAVDVLRQGTASPAINRTGQIVLNVADISEQAFISLGAYCNSDRGSDIFAGSVQITKIDFLN